MSRLPLKPVISDSEYGKLTTLASTLRYLTDRYGPVHDVVLGIVPPYCHFHPILYVKC